MLNRDEFVGVARAALAKGVDRETVWAETLNWSLNHHVNLNRLWKDVTEWNND
jgi:hypothetical protein